MNSPVEECDCFAEEAVGPHNESDHDSDCGYIRSGRTDEACGGCYGCISAQISWAHYRETVAARDDTCQSCGMYPADGHAWIDDRRYCHGDEEEVTCFMRKQWEMGSTVDPWLDFDAGGL